MSNYCQLAHAERCRTMVTTHSDMVIDSLTSKNERELPAKLAQIPLDASARLG